MKNILVNIFSISFVIICFGLMFIGIAIENLIMTFLGMGTFFFVCGIIVLKDKELIGVPFTIFGFVMLAYSISELFFNGEVGKLLSANAIPLFGLIFFIAGFCLYWFTIGILIWKRKRCTEEVYVKVVNVDYKDVTDEGRIIILARKTFQYTFEGKEYNYQSKSYNNLETNEDEFITYINPNKPEEIIIPNNKTSKILSIILSSVFMLSGASIFIAYILGYIND